ncbi:MAG: hypothetical protein A2083_06500 [Gemmatimonadetes bacterium GWC2_71_9]|nr:MAG: hypothetical protein A2083_06500 [Gemmatimonadetes bacterium GWC2_71_9]OGT96040.1 MAG: hypothetical protein A3I79_09040 [Gemmatimonadetes bacterium RIFCSPLOWO2_02_FULL_71_11]
MSLVTIVLAFVPVAVLFLGAGWLAGGRKLTRAAALVVTLEALVLTLLAALWFGSLGHGGWFAVFVLLGVLVAGAERGLRFAFLRSSGRAELRQFGLGLLKYVLAGAILAWRLG